MIDIPYNKIIINILESKLSQTLGGNTRVRVLLLLGHNNDLSFEP